MNQTAVLIVDDHPAMRQGLANLIEKSSGLTVCGEAGNRRETIAELQRRRPDFVLLDIALGEGASSGLDLIPEIRAHAGPVPILIYSMHDEMLYAERALRMGARGYLMKRESVRLIPVAIRRILDGDIYLGDAMIQRMLARRAGPAPGSPAANPNPPERLSAREFEVFRLVGKGLRPRDIAEALFLSVKTVETHRMNIRKKLGLSDAAAVARFAVQWFHRAE
jgi:DNA-binding NarL/FixJ family response regulator